VTLPLPVIQVASHMRNRLVQGHPWIYRDRIPDPPALPPGSVVRVQCGRWQGVGVWDPEGSIAVRLLSQQRPPDAAWVADRVAEAWALRAPIRATPTTAYRWLHGEGDGLPGLVVDLYGAFAVVQTYSPAVEPLVPWVLEALHAHTRLRGVVHRAGDGVAVVWGASAPDDLTVEEHGLLFGVDLERGQKTGLYFDQRENRRWLEPWCAGRRVLDCFAYTGAFTLYALRGGAAEVTSVDVAPTAGAVQRNLELNGFAPGGHSFVQADCFELLADYGQQGRRFDLVIVDPPAFARSKKQRRAALRSYTRLNQLALRCVEPGGWLATASCTAQVSPSAFREALAEAGRIAGCRVQVVHEAGQPPDHPVLAAFPEGRYLKFVVARVSWLV
jgi:23S rRNA (cytosine1962-C5)-methyltransferase